MNTPVCAGVWVAEPVQSLVCWVLPPTPRVPGHGRIVSFLRGKIQMRKANGWKYYQFRFKPEVRTAKHSLMKDVFLGVNGLVRPCATDLKHAPH